MRKAASIAESYLRFVSKDEPDSGNSTVADAVLLLIIALDKRAAAACRGPRPKKQIQPILFPGAHLVQIQCPILLAAPISFLANT
jgi:hypothetical protein